MIRQPLPPGVPTTPSPASTLALAPHFDDEVLGCGGLLAQLARVGSAVRVLFLSDGAGGAERIADRAAYARRRGEEAAVAVARLGVSGFDRADLPDGDLASHRLAIGDAIRRALLAQRPGRLLVPSPLEVSADHRAVFAALHDLLSAVRSGSELSPVVERLEILVYEVNHPGYPDLLVDVSDELDALGEAMAAYASQEGRHPYLRAALGLRSFRTHTLSPGIEAAEAYRRLELSDFTTRGHSSLVESLGGIAPRVEIREGPLVSVVVRTKDRPRLLAEALASLFAGSYGRAEVVLVNDGGKPPEIPARTPIPVTRIDLPENRGRAAAANAGIAAARGDYVAFLDDDDVVEREHLAVLAGLASASGQRVVYTDAAVTVHEPDVDEGWKCVERRLPYSRDFDRDRLLVDNYIPFHTLLMERSLLAEVGELDTALPFFEDWDLILRLSRRTSFTHLARVTCEYRHFRGSGHQILGERAREHDEFARRKAQVIAKHRDLLSPATLAGVVDGLRAEAVFATEATASERAARGREAAELGSAFSEQSRTLRSTWAEIERLNALVREMEGTRAWRLHRFFERVRGR